MRGGHQTIFHEGHRFDGCPDCYRTKYRPRRRDAESRIARCMRYDNIVYKGGICVDCGYKDHLDGLQFDHLPELGRPNRVAMHSRNLETRQAELDKCELVCGTCHAIRTAARGGTGE